MKPEKGHVLLVLPTDELIREFEPSQLLLQKIDLTFEILAQYIVDQWLENERHWGNYRPEEISSHELIWQHLMMDFLNGTVTWRLEAKDRHDLQILMSRFFRAVHQRIVPILEHFNFSDLQIAQSRVERWLGRSMVISVPC